MAEIKIAIGGREFEVACRDGEEHFLQSAAALLDNEAGALNEALGRMPETRMLLMAGLMLADKTASLEDQLKNAPSPTNDSAANEATRKRLHKSEVQLAQAQTELAELRAELAEVQAKAEERIAKAEAGAAKAESSTTEAKENAAKLAASVAEAKEAIAARDAAVATMQGMIKRIEAVAKKIKKAG